MLVPHSLFKFHPRATAFEEEQDELTLFAVIFFSLVESRVVLALTQPLKWERAGGHTGWREKRRAGVAPCVASDWGGGKVRRHLSTHLPLCQLQGQMARQKCRPRRKEKNSITHSVAPRAPSPSSTTTTSPSPPSLYRFFHSPSSESLHFQCIHTFF